MYSLKSQDQGLITLSQQDYLLILVESFLIDRRSQALSPDTIELYTKKLQYFLKYCERQTLTQVSQITPDFIRRYLLQAISKTHFRHCDERRAERSEPIGERRRSVSDEAISGAVIVKQVDIRLRLMCRLSAKPRERQ